MTELDKNVQTSNVPQGQSLLNQVKGELRKAKLDRVRSELKTMLVDLEKARGAATAIENSIVALLEKEDLAFENLKTLLEE